MASVPSCERVTTVRDKLTALRTLWKSARLSALHSCGGSGFWKLASQGQPNLSKAATQLQTTASPQRLPSAVLSVKVSFTPVTAQGYSWRCSVPKCVHFPKSTSLAPKPPGGASSDSAQLTLASKLGSSLLSHQDAQFNLLLVHKFAALLMIH